MDDDIESECFCGECAKVVQNVDKAFCCDGCEEWFHIKCTEVLESVYDFIHKSQDSAGFSWCCKVCRQQIDKLTTVTRYEIKNEMKSIVSAITDCIKNDLPNIIQDALLETKLSIERLSSHIYSNAESAKRNKVAEKLANNKILECIQETEETFKRNIESYQSHFAEKESRSHNIVISGIFFFGHDCLFVEVMELLHHVNPGIQPHEMLNCKQIGGNLSNNRLKYVLVSCRNRATVYWLHNYGSGRCVAKGLWINPDLTKVEKESR